MQCLDVRTKWPKVLIKQVFNQKDWKDKKKRIAVLLCEQLKVQYQHTPAKSVHTGQTT